MTHDPKSLKHIPQNMSKEICHVTSTKQKKDLTESTLICFSEKKKAFCSQKKPKPAPQLYLPLI